MNDGIRGWGGGSTQLTPKPLWELGSLCLGWLRAELRPLSMHVCPVDMHLYGCTRHVCKCVVHVYVTVWYGNT